MITEFCRRTRIIWLFPTASKRDPVKSIRFILTILNNEQPPCRRVRVDNDGALENSIYITNRLVYVLSIATETTGDDASLINRNNEMQDRSNHKMVIACLLEINQQKNE